MNPYTEEIEQRANIAVSDILSKELKQATDLERKITLLGVLAGISIGINMMERLTNRVEEEY